jgi:hypothetical protein
MLLSRLSLLITPVAFHRLSVVLMYLSKGSVRAAIVESDYALNRTRISR